MADKSYAFALGTAGSRRSAVWRLWTRDDETHLDGRTTHEDVALTAYPTGRWRIVVGRAISRWTRPKEFRPGWIRGPDLIVPHSGIPVDSPGPDRTVATTLEWLAPPPPGFVARLTLLFAAPRAEEGRWRPTDDGAVRVLVSLPLRRAGTVHLCRLDEPGDDGDGDDSGLDTGRLSTECAIVVSADGAGRPSLRESHRP